jgi:hypothetical protein
MKKYLFGVAKTAVALAALAAPAHAATDMSVTFRAIGEMTRAGFMCPSSAAHDAALTLGSFPDVHAYLSAHEAQAQKWILGGMRKFDQFAAQRGVQANCDLATSAALKMLGR